MAQETNTYLVVSCIDKNKIAYPTFLPSSWPKAHAIVLRADSSYICAFTLMQSGPPEQRGTVEKS